MTEVKPQDILLRVGPKMLERYQSLAVMGAGRGRVAPVPYTFSRADASTVIHRDGTIRLALAGVPRIEFVDLDGDGLREKEVLVLEGSRTNTMLRSEELNDAGWTKTQCSIISDGFTAPDSTITMDKILENTATSQHFILRSPSDAQSDNTSPTLTFFVAPAGRTWCTLNIRGKDGIERGRYFQLTGAGTVGSAVNGGAGHIVYIGNGIYRISVTANVQTGGTTPAALLYPATADGTNSYTGDGTSGILAWGAQWESNVTFESSYLKAVSSAVTRAADSLTVPFSFGPIDMTVLARMARPIHADVAGALGFSPRIYELAGSAVPFLRTFFNNSARELFTQIDTSGTDASTAAGAIPAGTELVYVSQYKNLATGGQVAHDVGSGLSSFSSAATAFVSFGNQVLSIGKIGSGGEELFGGLIDLVVLRGLFSRAECLAIP